MRRDIEEVRRILFYIEEHNSAIGLALDPSSPAGQHTLYQLRICIDHLVDGGPECAKVLIRRSDHRLILDSAGFAALTWAGHDFLDSVRDDTTWSKVKSRLGKCLDAVSMATIKTLAGEVVRQSLPS
jgi:hypothetical protein